jgi:hypothetical protein
MIITKGPHSKSLAELNAIKQDESSDSKKVIPEKQLIKMHQELEASKALKSRRSRLRKIEQASLNATAKINDQEYDNS